MTELQSPNQRRNLALTAIAVVVVLAAIFRMMYVAEPEPAPVPGQHADVQEVGDAGGAPIQVGVTYAGAIDALPAAAKLYVFVRPVGERMPLGVQAFDAHELPIAVDFASPTAATAAREIEVVARLSMSGAVAAQPEDLETVSGPMHFGAHTQNVQLALGTANGTAIAKVAAATSGLANAAAQAGESFRIPVHLALAPSVKLAPTTTVFLIVRAPGGPPMPLAVKRLAVSDLPTELSLSDSDAMVPGRSLRDAGNIEIIARASVSGNATPGPGDYEGRSGALRTDAIAAPIELLIAHPL